MTDEYLLLRQAAADAIRSNGFQPWAWEDTPASENDARRTYLDGVDSSEFFIWITKGSTSNATEEEVRRALRLAKPIMAFFVNLADVDPTTQDLITDVQKVVTFRKIDDQSEVQKEITVALQGVVARRIRKGRNSNLSEVLKSSKSGSVARCLASFLYVQISKEIATELASDISVGSLEQLQNLAGVAILVGEAGAGKTLAGERAHQNAVTRALMGGPFPIWIRADSIMISIEETVRAITKSYFDVASYGVHLVVDGLDESNLDYAKVLGEAQSLSAIWPDTTIILTARSREDIDRHPLTIRMPELTDVQCLQLANLTGRAPQHLMALPIALREAVHRPLFALLLGSALQENVAADAPQALVAHLVTKTLKRNKSSDQQRLDLADLAVKAMNRGGRIPLVDVHNVETLASTGLLEFDELTARFSLLIVGQWFAGMAIQSGSVTIKALSQDRAHLLSWRHAIAMGIAAANEDVKFELLKDASIFAPELFAWLIKEAIPTGYTQPVANLPTENESGRQIRLAMNASVRALGPLAKHVTPVLESGQLAPLSISVEKNSLMYVWKMDGDTAKDGEILKMDRVPVLSVPGARWSRDAGRSGWALRLALETIASNIDNVLKQRKFPLAPALQLENDWALLVAICSNRRTSSELSVSDARQQLKYMLEIVEEDDSPRIIVQDISTNVFELKRLQEQLPSHGALRSPWPEADLKKSDRFVGDNFSDEQLKSRIVAIYSAALEAHLWYSQGPFNSLSSLSPTNAIRPAICDMHLIRDGDNGIFSQTLQWSLEPLPKGEIDRVQCDSRADATDFIPDLSHWEYVKGLRPSVEFFNHTHHHGIVDIFGATPATDLVYEWLRDDLKQLGWLN